MIQVNTSIAEGGKVMFEKERASQLLDQKKWTGPTTLDEEFMRQLANTPDQYSFEDVLLIVKQLMPNEVVPLMNVYAASVKKLDHVQDAFEYATLHEQIDLLERLISVHELDDLLSEWVAVYRLVYNLMGKRITNEDGVEAARKLYEQVQNPLMKIRAEYIEINESYKIGNLRNVNIIEKKIRQFLKKIDPSFIKSALATRLSLLIGILKFYHQGCFKEGENYFLAVAVNEASSDSTLSSTYHGLAHVSLVNNEKEKCFAYLEKSIELADKAKLYDYKNRLENEYFPFVQNYFGERIDLNNVVLEEQAHQYVVRGDKQKALHLIEQLERKGRGTPYTLYYKGKATKDMATLLRAIKSFAKESDLFRITLIEKEINRLIYGEVKR